MSVEHHGIQQTGCMDIEPEPYRGVPSQSLLQKTDESGSCIPRAVHLEGDSFFCYRGYKPCPTPPATAIRAGKIKLHPGSTCSGCSKSIRCDTTPIVCSTCQQHFHRTCSHLITRSQKGIQGFICFLCSGGDVALPSTATVTSNSALPRRCLLCRTKI